MTQCSVNEITPLFLIRAYEPGDLRFVVGGWHASNRYAPASQGVKHAIYEEDRWRIEDTIGRSDVLVATTAEDTNALFGFACYQTGPDRPRIHYVYVKRDARRLGIARALLSHLAHEPAWFTHLPVIRSKLPIPPQWDYRPWFMGGMK